MTPPREDGQPRRALPATGRWCAAVGVVCLLSAACSVTTRYEVLSFFFDGVPDPSNPASLEFQDPPVPSIVRTGRLYKKSFKAWNEHEPYRERQCAECHKQRPARKKGMGFHLQDLTALRAPVEQLCIRCHKPPARKFRHAPALLGKCVLCHHPHMSPNPRLLLQPDSNAVCATCHEEDTFMTKEQHAAYGTRECHACHDPHASDDEYLLRVDWEEFADPPLEPQGPPLPNRLSAG